MFMQRVFPLVSCKLDSGLLNARNDRKTYTVSDVGGSLEPEDMIEYVFVLTN
jgi:hypothetical protein